MLPVCIHHLPDHHSQKLRELNGAVAIGVHLLDHVPEQSFGGVLTQGSHELSENFSADGAVFEEVKCFLELSNLLLCQLVCSTSTP